MREPIVRIELHDAERGGLVWWADVFVHCDQNAEDLLDPCLRDSLQKALDSMRDRSEGKVGP